MEDLKTNGNYPLARATLVVQDRHAQHLARLRAAREGRHGLQIMTIDQMAVRLAGGFCRPIDGTALRAAVQTVLTSSSLSELDTIRQLPGMIDATTTTLQKIWTGDFAFIDDIKQHPRLQDMLQIEIDVLKNLPSGMMRPADLVATALSRLVHAPAVLGSVRFQRITYMPTCWRKLILELALHVHVNWNSAPNCQAEWLDATPINIEVTNNCKPAIELFSTATPLHEAVEAMRWVRRLLCSGTPPEEIALCSVSTERYDQHFQALRMDADFGLYFVHGVSAICTQDGQAAAALADILVRGLDQARLRRLVSLCPQATLLANLPNGWLKVLPADMALATGESRKQLLKHIEPQHWPDGIDHLNALRDLLESLSQGPEAASALGDTFLSARALSLWHQALLKGPASAIDVTLAGLRIDDDAHSRPSPAWMPAHVLAASPRQHMRLLGLNASQWPRKSSEDRLLPSHIVDSKALEPLLRTDADRRHFVTLMASTQKNITLSWPRRDSTGRLLGKSPLLDGLGEENYLSQQDSPAQAFSETDRLLAHPSEFASNTQAISAQRCWHNWRQPAITANDGLIKPDHPLIREILARTQSATSLSRLMRNPLGFVWAYAFGWREPGTNIEPMSIEPLALGNLAHAVLEHALRELDTTANQQGNSHVHIQAAVAAACQSVADGWLGCNSIPPALIWERTLKEVERKAVAALNHREEISPARSYAEMAFGESTSNPDHSCLWDTSRPVSVPGTEFRIRGYIDRIDITADGKQVHVCDYKTGRPPKKPDKQLDGGKELQRCLYTFATQALLGEDVSINAFLLHWKEQGNQSEPAIETYPLNNADDTITSTLTKALNLAYSSLLSGAALPGPDAGNAYDPYLLALPAGATAIYCKHKMDAVRERLGEATLIWEAP